MEKNLSTDTMIDIHDTNALFGMLEAQGILDSGRRQHGLRRLETMSRLPARGKKKSREAENALPPSAIGAIAALDMQTADGERLSEETIMRAVAREAGIPFVKLDPLDLDLQVVTGTIPKSFALRHLLLPFAVGEGELLVASCDPAHFSVLGEIERATQMKVLFHLSTETDIRRMLAEFFGFRSSISAAETSLSGPRVDLGNLEQYVRVSSTQEIASTDQHIKGAVDHLFNYAIDQRASDIHIEPKREKMLVRLRIDGILHTVYSLPRVVHPPILSRIKTLARLDISEKRRPQDGRIKIALGQERREAEIRVSTVPVAFGEKAVLRILDPMIIFQELESLGLTPADLVRYNAFLRAPHGIVLVTGPTGSGKSTTLYSTLKKLATPEKNIVTVEDPVEMIHEEFNQIAVQPQVEVTFATILRNILRQDPDIIMIGEIRDLETARYAVQAALTGHLVFSTLHTNDAVSAITRLVDLGVQPFLLASTLVGVMAQRLVRRICPHCAESFQAPAVELFALGFSAAGQEGAVSLRRGKGCQECRGTGYLGRVGVYELFALSSRLKKMVVEKKSGVEILAAAVQEGMTTLDDGAWEKIRSGETTYQEALRVMGETGG